MRLAQHLLVAAVVAGLLGGPTRAAFDAKDKDSSTLQDRINDDNDRKERVAGGRADADAGLRPAADVQATHLSSPAAPGPRPAGREAFLLRLQQTSPEAPAEEPRTATSQGVQDGSGGVPEALQDITVNPPKARPVTRTVPSEVGMGTMPMLAMALAVLVLAGITVACCRARHHS